MKNYLNAPIGITITPSFRTFAMLSPVISAKKLDSEICALQLSDYTNFI